MSDESWEREYLRDPIACLFQEVDEGGVVTDGEALLKLGNGVEGLFRREVAHQYVGWPQASTTDGSVAELCRRIAPDVIEAVGFTCLDFGPAVFPFRAEVTRIGGDGLEIVLAIGDADAATGAPPHLRDPVLVPVRNDEGSVIGVELVAARRQEPVRWTGALRVILTQT